MKITAKQFLGTLALDKHYPAVTENRFHSLCSRLARKAPPTSRQERRRKMFDRQCGVCVYCGERMTMDRKDRKKPSYLTMEHVTPVSKAPFPGTPRVVVGACKRCNAMKGNRSLLTFMLHLNQMSSVPI